MRTRRELNRLIDKLNISTEEGEDLKQSPSRINKEDPLLRRQTSRSKENYHIHIARLTRQKYC